MSELPEGWGKASILDLAIMIRGVTYSKGDAQEKEAEGFTGVLRANNISEKGLVLDDLVYVPNHLVSNQQLVRAGDVVIATSSGSINVVGKAKQASSNLNVGFGAFCAVLRPLHEIEPRYFGFFFGTDAYRTTISALARGVNINNLKKSHFEQINIPIAPLAEQKRIADKLDTLLARVDQCRARLDTVPLILKRFRQAVLAAATSGQLTKNWREENHNSIFSVESFLEFIEQQRKQLWEAQNSNRKYSAPVRFDEHNLPEVPDSWAWSSADALCSQITDGEHIQPPYQSSGYPMLTAKHVRDGYVAFEDVGYISESDFKKCLGRCAPENNDILIVSVGATTGRAAIVENCPSFAIVRSVLLLKPLISSRYLLRWIQSPWCFNWMTQASGASAQAHLYIKDTKRMPIPVPPVEEQNEIVRRVETLFAYANRLEERYKSARLQVEQLTPALLAKAFRGELVSQDPADEPAAMLLEHIRAERMKTDTINEVPQRKASGGLMERLRVVEADVHYPNVPEQLMLFEHKGVSKDFMLTRTEIQPTHLSAILKVRGPLTAEALWSASQLSIDDFYEQLKDEEDRGQLKEHRDESPNMPRLLEAV